MSGSLLFSINTVLPVFLLVVFGWGAKRFSLLSDTFFTPANRFVFRITLPVTLFLDVYEGGTFSFSGKLALFCICFLFFEIAVLFLTVPFCIGDNQKRGAFLQGAYRSNVAIMGVPLVASIFGDAGNAVMATVMPITVVLYNVIAVIVLSIYAPMEKRQSPLQTARGIFKTVVFNPLIIGIVLGALALFLPFSLPTVATKTLGYLDNLTLPLSLLCLGASFDVSKFKSRFGLAITASLLRCVVFPAIAVTSAVLLGFTGANLGVIFVIFGSSTAIASFVMSGQMGSDAELSGQIVLLSTLLSAFTIFLGTTLLKYFSLI